MCSEQYVFSNRGHRLSTRLTLPKQPEHTLGDVIYIHGYDAHSNRPHVQTMAKQLREANYGMITFDFHGHGYSTGKRPFLHATVNEILPSLVVASRPHLSR